MEAKLVSFPEGNHTSTFSGNQKKSDSVFLSLFNLIITNPACTICLPDETLCVIFLNVRLASR